MLRKNLDIEDLIAEEDMVVTISHEGYIKRMSPRAYRVQNRGGRGVNLHENKRRRFCRTFSCCFHACLSDVSYVKWQVSLVEGL